MTIRKEISTSAKLEEAYSGENARRLNRGTIIIDWIECNCEENDYYQLDDHVSHPESEWQHNSLDYGAGNGSKHRLTPNDYVNR